MNLDDTHKLAGVIELLLQSSSRVNEAKPRRYWYPLSLATYGVEEILEALDSLCSFRTSMWEKTLTFEKRFAEFQGAAHAVMVNSGSSADLLLAFLLTNPARPLLDRGAEILAPAVTWPTQIWSPMMAGMKVRFVDVDPATLNIDLNDLERKITPRTRALSIVHLMGNPCDMDRIHALAQKHKLVVLEDCCEALGSEFRGKKVGTFGLGAAFSFFFSHHMVTLEGGMITCPDPITADQLRILRAHGWLRNADPSLNPLPPTDIDPRYAFVNWGFNLRPTELQAGFGLQQLQKLPAFTARRALLAQRFLDYIDTKPQLLRPAVCAGATPVWFALPLMVAPDASFSRNKLTSFLEDRGVETRPIVAGNLARHPAASLFPELRDTALPGADAVHDRGLYVGLSPLQSDESLDRLLQCFDDFLAQV